MSFIPEILDQHAEEAAFLWLLRDASATAPHCVPRDLRRLDERIAAHLDGLLVAGEHGWAICSRELHRQEQGEVFAASVLALESKESDRFEQVLSVARKERFLQRPLISAIGWAPLSTAQPVILHLLQADADDCVRIGLRGAASHRWLPPPLLGPPSESACVRAAQLRTWAELGCTDRLEVCLNALDASDSELRFWAAWSAVLLGSSRGLEPLREIALSRSPYASRALDVVSRKLRGGEARDWHAELSGQPGTERSAILAAGMIGDPELVPWLIERLSSVVHRRVAGQAISSMLGWTIGEEPLKGEVPREFEAPPSDDPFDEEVAQDPDEHLSWPDADAVAARWADERGQFSQGTRWICGEPKSEQTLRRLLGGVSQQMRASVALELSLLRPDESLVETRSWVGLRPRDQVMPASRPRV